MEFGALLSLCYLRALSAICLNWKFTKSIFLSTIRTGSIYFSASLPYNTIDKLVKVVELNRTNETCEKRKKLVLGDELSRERKMGGRITH